LKETFACRHLIHFSREVIDHGTKLVMFAEADVGFPQEPYCTSTLEPLYGTACGSKRVVVLK